MKNMFKDAVILFLITLIAGALLGAVYEITKEPIAYQEALALQNACSEVFSEADSFEEMTDFRADEAAVWLAENGYNAQEIENIYLAKDSSQSVAGFVLTVTTKEGYGGNISFTMGVRNDGTLNGISLLSIAETPGLGMQAGEVLVPQFRDKKEYPFYITKTGAKETDQIDAISGATVTSTALTDAVNAGMFYILENMLEGGTADGK